jgi:hypothetical protein
MKVNNDDNEYKPSTKKYWIAWFILMTVNLLCAVFKIYPIDPIEYFFKIWFVISFILIVIYGVYYAKLMNYLEKKHFEKWIELTDFSFFMLGFDRASKMSEFFKSKETLNDPIVAKLKSEVKSTWLLIMVHGGSFILAVIIFFFLIVFFNFDSVY